jgi:hypothetical protein
VNGSHPQVGPGQGSPRGLPWGSPTDLSTGQHNQCHIPHYNKISIFTSVRISIVVLPSQHTGMLMD